MIITKYLIYYLIVISMAYEYHKISHLGSIRQGGYLTQRDIASRRGCIAAEKDI